MSFDNLTSNIAAEEILKNLGYALDHNIIQDGKIHYVNKKKKQWYACHENFLIVRDWQGRIPNYQGFINEKKYNSLSSKEREDLHKKAEEVRLAAEREKEELYKIAAIKASEEWKTFSQSGESEYLERKKLSAVSGIKFGQNKKGKFIAVALTNEKEEIVNIQKIYDGDSKLKLFLNNARMTGCFSTFGKSDSNLIYVCEGVATGLSILKAIPNSMVVIAYTCHNLIHVTEKIVTKFKGREIIIAADDDNCALKKNKNAGLEAGELVAKKFDLKLIHPKFKDTSSNPSDFNDLHCLEGLSEVTSQLSNLNYCDPEPILFASLNHPKTKLDSEAVLGKNSMTSFAKEVSKSTETPEEFPLISIISCLAVALQGKVSVRITADWKEPVVIQAVILGKSGDGKSPVFHNVIRPLLDWELKKQSEYEDKLSKIKEHNDAIDREIKVLQTPKKLKGKNAQPLTDDEREAMCKKIDDLKKKKKELPPSPRLILQDTTAEQITNRLDKQGGKVGIFDHEGGLFNTIAGRYSSGVPNLDVMLKGYNGSEIIVDRADRSIRIEEAYVSTCIFMQPDIFRTTKNIEQLKSSGLLSRPIFGNPESLVGSRKFNHYEIDEEIKNSYYQIVNKAANFNKKIELKLDEEARELFRDFQIQIERKRKPGEEYDNSNAIGSWIEKIKGNAVRIAGILQFVEDQNSEFISKEIMLKAINFAEILIEHAISVFNYIGCDVKTINAIKILEHITSKGHTKFRHCQIRREKRNDTAFTDKDQFTQAMIVLVDRSILIPIEEPTKINKASEKVAGRPTLTEWYRLNSKLITNPSAKNARNTKIEKS